MGRSRRPKGNAGVQKKFQDCSARFGLEHCEHTFGALFCMDACGCIMAPPCWEMVGAESCAAVHQYIVRLFEGTSLKILEDEELVIVYDDACHLLPIFSQPQTPHI
ncbi:hypothetical protein CEUSTIGMA_g3090.t1 [Chlamydomonas eustigma]|uniref:Uncharacterized protein n=1 Tax=Chlamydomonas eustigma TaxID=1157962 RepID=A0A250WXY7_9CHLO|nr:hypothetical protein CEUSTIGMA_g3090.t1 [Chlamydomonas eustigma]|eukprot:GAX75646.1 hypothetical protein CEUSTIGMA_g3090.t1 [Chlamydomonas eustigma]